MAKNKIDAKMIQHQDDSELVIEIGPLAIFRGSSLEFEQAGESPTIRPCYTVAVNPNWLDGGGEVEMCISGSVGIVGIVGKEALLKAVNDPLVQIINADGQYAVLVLKEDGQLESELLLERMPENIPDTKR
jgi:hypothetical protein